MAGVLQLLGNDHALLVSSNDGLDELSISAPTRIVEVREGELRSYELAPEDVGFERSSPELVPGGDPQQNAQTTRRILAGEPGAALDVALLNAGAAIYVGGGPGSLADGVAKARVAIESGAAEDLLTRFVGLTQELAEGVAA